MTVRWRAFDHWGIIFHFFFLSLATGGTSHALGTASVTASEPKIAPPSAVTFLVTGGFWGAVGVVFWGVDVAYMRARARERERQRRFQRKQCP